MAHTSVTKTHSQNTGAANTFSYSGSFDVFKGTEVVVLLDGVELTHTASTINESASPREYTVDTAAKTVHIGGADLSSGSIVLRPNTDMGDPTPRAEFTPGASITSADLNNNQLQLLRKAMEYDETKMSTTGDTMTGHLTMGEDTTIIFEGATDDGFETTLTVADPSGSDKTITLPNVTGTVVTTGDTGTVTATMLAANSVDSSELVDGSIDASHIASGAVTTAKLGADAVDGTKLADNAVDSEHYTDGSIDTAHIADLNVTAAKIAADAINGSKIADDSINSEHYIDGSIDTAHLANSAVGTAALSDDAVTTAKIVNDAITAAKIADDVVNSEHIAAGAVDLEHMSANSVDSDQYVDGSIDTAHIGGTQVTTAKLASNSVTTSKITDANVTTLKIADSNVTLGKLHSDLKQTSVSDSDTQLPTSGAVVDYVAAQLQPFGGFEAIATEVAFPNTQPASGVVISIADAGGVVVNGSGTSTTGRTVGGSTVTINNFASNFNSSTIDAGVHLLVSSTGSSQIYNYHKATLKEADLLSLSNDINDFAARYRVQSGEPSSSLDAGDLTFDTAAGKMKVYDGGSWNEVASTGDFKFIVMTNAGTTNAATLNGSNVTFDLKESSTGGVAAAVTNAAQLMVSVNGVIQKPNSGTNTSGLDGFVMTDADTIKFCDAPESGDEIFIIQSGSAVAIPTPGDGTVSAAKIASGAVETAKIADGAVTTAKIAKPLDFADNEKARFGTGTDLEVSSAGTGGLIKTNNGALTIATASLHVNNAADTEQCIHTTEDGSVELFHNDVKTFETIAGGIQVQGTEGGDGTINLFADEGDDNADKFRTTTKAAGGYFIESYASGSWRDAIEITPSEVVELNYEGSKKLETTSYGVLISSRLNSPTISIEDYNSTHETGALKLGTGNDLKLYHDGSHNYLDSSNGNIYLRVNSTENAIKCTENGAVNLYYDNSQKLTTSSTGIEVTGNVHVNDSDKLQCGDSADLKIYHDGSNSYISDQGTGNLNILSSKAQILNAAGNEAMAKFTADGAVELYHDNSKKFETTSGGATVTGNLSATSNLLLADSVKARFGTGEDLQVYHDGTDARFHNTTGRIITRTETDVGFYNSAGDESLAIFTVNGSCDLYQDNVKVFQTHANGARVIGTEGASATFYMLADEGDDNGDYWRLVADSGSSNFKLQNQKSGSWETNLRALGQDAIELYHNNSKKLETHSWGVDIIGDCRADEIKVEDDDYVTVGSGNDLRLSHNGTNSWIQNNTGNLYITGSDVRFLSQGNEDMIKATGNGSVEIYHDAVKKAETTSTGFDVSGKLNVTTTSTSTVAATFKNTGDGSDGTEIQFTNDSASPADGDQTAYLQFNGNDDNGNGTIYNAIIGYTDDVTSGTTDGSLKFYCRSNGSFTQRLLIAADGTFTGSGSNDISDERLKDNIATVVDPIGKIKALKGRTFTWKPEANLPEGTKYGFIAQEVEEVVSDLVDNKHGLRQFDKDNNLIPQDEKAKINKDEGTTESKSVHATGVVPILVEALKEALTKIETLETKVAALEAK